MTDFPANADEDTVDDVVDKAVERADTPPDTFRPFSVADRHTKRVRDDHAPNQALHDAIAAAAEDDDRIGAVNLMGSHEFGNRHKGEPRYNVRVEVVNGGMGHPVVGATFVGRLIDRRDVHVTDVAECSDDHLVVCLRPIEARVEPIDVRVDEIPDRVADAIGDDFVRVGCGCGEYDVAFEGEVPDSFDVVCPECGNHFGQGPAPDEPCPCDHDHDDRPPVEPIREWVADNLHVFLKDKGDEQDVAEEIADAIAEAGADE